MSATGRDPEPPFTPPLRATHPATRVLTVLAIAVGVGYALRLWWTSDDAYISFRYARNLQGAVSITMSQFHHSV